VHFRVEILDEIVGISMKGSLRLAEKLGARASACRWRRSSGT